MLLSNPNHIANKHPEEFKKLLETLNNELEFGKKQTEMYLLAERRRKIDNILEKPNTEQQADYIINNWIKKNS